MAQIWIIANSHQKQGVAGKAKKKKKSGTYSTNIYHGVA
jgi:hypothetical protein